MPVLKMMKCSSIQIARPCDDQHVDTDLYIIRVVRQPSGPVTESSALQGSCKNGLDIEASRHFYHNFDTLRFDKGAEMPEQ